MLTNTTRCSEFEHPEFAIECEDVLALTGTLNWFTDWLESSVQSGQAFQPGQTVQLGWSILRVSQNDAGLLTFSEPDFTHSPVQFLPGVTKSLLHLFLQKSVTDSVGLTASNDIPSLRMSAVICSRFSAKNPVFFSRTEPRENDCGWFFGCLDPAHDHSSLAELRSVSLYNAALNHAFVMVPYLGLPAGTDVILAGKDIEIYQNRQPLPFQAGSYLAQLQQSH